MTFLLDSTVKVTHLATNSHVWNATLTKDHISNFSVSLNIFLDLTGTLFFNFFEGFTADGSALIQHGSACAGDVFLFDPRAARELRSLLAFSCTCG